MIRKTKTVRLTAIVDIRRKLRNLGYNASHSEVKRLFDVLSAFVENGDYVKDKFVIDALVQLRFVIDPIFMNIRTYLYCLPQVLPQKQDPIIV